MDTGNGKDEEKLRTIDDYVKSGRDFGKYQIMWSCLSVLIITFVGANMVASVFEAYEPTSRCITPEEKFVSERCGINWTSEMQKKIRPDKNRTKSILYHCYRYQLHTQNCSIWYEDQRRDNESTAVSLFGSEPISLCTEWVFDENVMRKTIVTDFQLVCGDKWGSYIAQSALMFGVGLGCMLSGILSDRCGRRNAFLVSCIGSVVVGTSLSFAPTYLIYFALRTLLGIFIYNAFPILFVLDTETTTAKFRPLASQILEIGFPLGFIFLSAVSYAVREWRKIQLVLSLPFLAGTVMWWYMLESPRWLHSKNRTREYRKVIKTIYKMNTGKTLNIEELVPGEVSSQENHEGICSIFKRPNLRCVTLKWLYIWYANSCVYYGLTLNAGELGGNPFSNMCWIGLAEIVAVVVTLPALNTIGRRITGSASTIVAGVLCLLTLLIPTGIAPIAILGKFAISISFNTMYIHTSEMFPTSVRSTGVGICSAMARVGGVLSPLIALTEMIGAYLPYILYGITAVISGILMLTLPETLGVKLPQTTAEGEEFLKRKRSICVRTKQRI